MRTRLRSTKEVVDRARALAAFVRHAHGESQNANGRGFSPHEAQLLSRPAAAWTEQDVLDATWRGEALGTLLWALSLVPDLPPYDTPFEHFALTRGFDASRAELRSRSEIEEEREAARLWHWRARTTIVQRRSLAALPEQWASFEQLVATTTMRGHEAGLLPRPLRGDFPAFGTSYRHLTEEQRALAHSIAAERHYALEWVCRGGASWDEIRTDT
jgi:hypothetical protein